MEQDMRDIDIQNTLQDTLCKLDEIVKNFCNGSDLSQQYIELEKLKYRLKKLDAEITRKRNRCVADRLMQDLLE